MQPTMSPITQLSLSGGGFRAAFFHLGALHALAEAGRLRELQLLVTVSGGSIAAAFYLQEWLRASEEQVVDDAQLSACALRAYQALFKKSRRSPRVRILASVRGMSRGLVRSEWAFSEAMVRQNERWFKPLAGAHAAGLLPRDMPEWRIATTDYAQGCRVLFVVNDRTFPRQADAAYVEGHDLTIPQAIAASSAVPGVFEPVRIGDRLLGDGGILDNLGVRELSGAAGCRVCIDASATALAQRRVDGWSTPMRAMDLLMEQDRKMALDGRTDELITLREPISQPSNIGWWPLLQSLRTDLDDFAPIEASLLFLAGYQRARGDATLPCQAPDIGVETMWLTMSTSDATGTVDRADIAEERALYMKELNLGKYSVAAGIQHPSVLAVFMSLGSLYMAAMSVVVIAIFALSTLGVAVRGLPHWFLPASAWSFALSLWPLGSLWLARYIEWRGGLGIFGWVRQCGGAIMGGALLPFLLPLSLFMRIKAFAFSTRNISAWRRIRAVKRHRLAGSVQQAR